MVSHVSHTRPGSTAWSSQTSGVASTASTNAGTPSKPHAASQPGTTATPCLRRELPRRPPLRGRDVRPRDIERRDSPSRREGSCVPRDPSRVETARTTGRSGRRLRGPVSRVDRVGGGPPGGVRRWRSRGNCVRRHGRGRWIRRGSLPDERTVRSHRGTAFRGVGTIRREECLASRTTSSTGRTRRTETRP